MLCDQLTKRKTPCYHGRRQQKDKNMKKMKTNEKTKEKLIFRIQCEMSNLSTSTLHSPSLDADEPRDKTPRISPGNTSSLRCTVNEFLPFLPKPMRLFRPFCVRYSFEGGGFVYSFVFFNSKIVQYYFF